MTDKELMQQMYQLLLTEPRTATVCDKLEVMLRERLAQPQQEPVAWRELCRRLYVELFHCDQQMMAKLDEDGEPMWQQGTTVRDVLADAKAALEGTRPQAREPLTDDEIANILPDDDTPMSLGEAFVKFARAIEAKHGIKEQP